MRITCPRCNANYEVPASVMPSGGRDVQCSDCGHSWYQLVAHPTVNAAPDAGDESGTLTRPGAIPDLPLTHPTKTTPEPQAPDSSADADTDEARRLRRLRAVLDGHKARAGTQTVAVNNPPRDSTFDDIDAGPTPRRGMDPQMPVSPPPDPRKAVISEPIESEAVVPEASGLPDLPKRALDPAVVAVLRAEAEFERHARVHGPLEALEMQPELGLTAPARGRRDRDTVRDRLARLQAAERDSPVTPLTGGEETFPDPAGLGRSLQPEAPEISHTALVPHREAGLPVRATGQDLAMVEAARARRDFRVGFGLSLSVCLGAAGLYLATPTLAGMLPDQADLFAGIARTGADVHLALASAVQDWLARLGTWMTDLASNPPAA